MGAVLQVMRGARGSAAETATSFDAFLRALNNAETAKRAQRAGIKLFDPEALKQGKHELLPLPTILNNIAKYSGGDRLKLGKVFTDSDSVAGLSRMLDEYKQLGKLKTLDSYLAVRGDGTQVLKDAGETLHDLNTQIVRLREEAERFASVNLSGPIGALADTLSQLDNNEINALYEQTKDWVILLGGAVVAWKAIQVGMAAASAIRAVGGAVAGRSSTGGIAGALGGGGPVPVYIVNAPTLGTGAAGEGAAGKGVGKAGALLGRAGMVGAAMLGGWEIGTTIGDAISKNFIEGTPLADHIGRAVARGLATLGNEEAQRSLDREKATKLELTVKTDAGTLAKITQKSDNVDAKLRAGVTQATL